MSVDSDEADEFTSGLARLSELLSERSRSIYDVQYSLLAFGGWVIEAGTRHKRLRFTWDGKENHLFIDSANFPSSGAIPEWNPVTSHTVALTRGNLNSDSVTALAHLVAQHT